MVNDLVRPMAPPSRRRIRAQMAWKVPIVASRAASLPEHIAWFERYEERIRGGADLAWPKVIRTVRRSAGQPMTTDGPFIEGKELLLWTWAHRFKHRWYRPTELMTWAVMQRALSLGCESFDLMGLGDFKTKFGAELDHRKYRWVRSRYWWLTGMRDLAAKGLQWQQAVRGRVARWGSLSAGDEA